MKKENKRLKKALLETANDMKKIGVSKKIDYKKLFDSFSTYAHIIDGSHPEYDGHKPKKQKLYFGANYEDIPTVVIKWSEKGRGFGEYVFQYKDGQMYCHSECDSPETVKRVLCTMVDQCIFDEKVK